MNRRGHIALLLIVGTVTIFFFRSHHPFLKRTAPASETVSIASPTNFSLEARRSVSWKEIETPDYNRYVANLRKIGCPDITIDDIVVADVDAPLLERA